MISELKYLTAYSLNLRNQVQRMIAENSLSKFLLQKYPQPHNVVNDKALRDYVMTLKNHFIKKSAPLSQIIFDPKIHIINNALGTHRYVSRVQGGKLKSKFALAAFSKKLQNNF